MIKNMGSTDRFIRTLVALVFAVLILTGQVEGTLALLLGIVAAGLLLTSAVSVCPAYIPLKFSTRAKESK